MFYGNTYPKIRATFLGRGGMGGGEQYQWTVTVCGNAELWKLKKLDKIVVF